jgi:electron transfer flavoprotein beta subunit
VGVDRAILLETDGRDWDGGATAAAIVAAVRQQEAAGQAFDLILFGSESADSGGYQVGVRVAYALDRPCLTGLKELKLEGQRLQAGREAAGGRELYQVDLPAVATVKEGLNLPRYPSLPGRLKAKKKPLERVQPAWPGATLEKVRLKLPSETAHQVAVLGHGPAAAAQAVAIFHTLGILEP